MPRLSKRRLNDDLFPSRPVEMPNETNGMCKRCGELKELGDGFCIKCWDKGSNKNKEYRLPKSKRRKRKYTKKSDSINT